MKRDRSILPVRAMLAVILVLGAVQSAPAQLFDRPLVIKNARIVTMAGPAIERGQILVRGDRIEALGTDLKVPFMARVIDASGKTVTPGLIDSWSALGRQGASADEADPKADAWDAFDRYDRDAFREALQQGVTTVYVGPIGGSGVLGTGVVVKLIPAEHGSAGIRVEEGAALAINLASDQPAIARLKLFNRARGQFRKALEYRKALEDYAEDLEEYLKKLEERAEKEKAESESSEDGEEAEKGGDEGGKDEKPPPEDKPKPEPKPKPKPKTKTKAGTRPGADDDGKGENGGSGKPEKSGEEEEKEELTKPTKPAPDRVSDRLLEAIDHELPVRIEAHRSEDILNALALAVEFNLDILLEGATEAYLVAEPLADADVPVVLGPILRTLVFEDGPYRRHQAHCAAVLESAGVRWAVGSGGRDAAAARFVGQNAQLTMAYGAAAAGSWLTPVTVSAAEFLGMSKRIGRLRPGMQADLVIWSGDPADAATVPERVIVEGKTVYVAPTTAGRGGA